MIAKAYADQHQLKKSYTRNTTHSVLSILIWSVTCEIFRRRGLRSTFDLPLRVVFYTRFAPKSQSGDKSKGSEKKSKKSDSKRERNERERERETTAIVQGARRKEERRGETREREREGEREGVVFIPFLSFLHSSILPFVISFGGKKNKGFGSLRWMKTDKERIT